MARRATKEFMQVIQASRNRLERVVTANSLRALKKLYDEANTNLAVKLRRAVGGGKGSTFTAHQLRIAQAQVRVGQAQLAQRMAGKMGPLTKQAQESALKGLVDDVAKLSKQFTGAETVLPVDEAGVFANVIAKRQPSLMQMHQTSMARYGAAVVQKVEGQLALSLIQGESPQEAIDGVAEAIDGEWWQGERIVRTETAYAFNATHADGIAESAEELPELKMRWEEHCDAAGQPLDDRVGVDSIAMHGQVTGPGDVFTMPATAPFPDKNGNTEVPDSLVGEEWEFPPNRPNDRSVLAPWMPDWGVPGWRYDNGRRIWLNK